MDSLEGEGTAGKRSTAKVEREESERGFRTFRNQIRGPSASRFASVGLFDERSGRRERHMMMVTKLKMLYEPVNRMRS